MALNMAQHKIVNLVKTLWEFLWLRVTMYLMNGPRQFFFFQCRPETPKGWTPLENNYSFFKKKNLFILREREREGEREGEKHQCVVASHAPPTGDLAHNPGMCPDWESNLRPFALQAHTQSTELHQPGPPLILKWAFMTHLVAICHKIFTLVSEVLRFTNKLFFNQSRLVF